MDLIRNPDEIRNAASVLQAYNSRSLVSYVDPLKATVEIGASLIQQSFLQMALNPKPYILNPKP